MIVLLDLKLCMTMTGCDGDLGGGMLIRVEAWEDVLLKRAIGSGKCFTGPTCISNLRVEGKWRATIKDYFHHNT